MDAKRYREAAGMVDGVELIGSGTLAPALVKPSATVIGIDAPRSRRRPTSLIPEATAKMSMRIAPGADAEHELGLLVEHLRNVAPWGVHVEVEEATGRLAVRGEDGRACCQGGDGGDGRGLETDAASWGAAGRSR